MHSNARKPLFRRSPSSSASAASFSSSFSSSLYRGCGLHTAAWQFGSDHTNRRVCIGWDGSQDSKRDRQGVPGQKVQHLTAGTVASLLLCISKTGEF
jgi:hypothetical protein